MSLLLCIFQIEFIKKYRRNNLYLFPKSVIIFEIICKIRAIKIFITVHWRHKYANYRVHDMQAGASGTKRWITFLTKLFRLMSASIRDFDFTVDYKNSVSTKLALIWQKKSSKVFLSYFCIFCQFHRLREACAANI